MLSISIVVGGVAIGCIATACSIVLKSNSTDDVKEVDDKRGGFTKAELLSKSFDIDVEVIRDDA